MKFFTKRKKDDINVENLFYKISQQKSFKLDENELYFLQTPQKPNLNSIAELLCVFPILKWLSFFDHLHEFIEKTEDKEQKAKITLFTQALINCSQEKFKLYIQEDEFDPHKIMLLHDASRRFKIIDSIGHKIEKLYELHSSEKKNTNHGILKIYFDTLSGEKL